MNLTDRVENVGGNGSAYAGYGGVGLFLLAIFLIVLFAAFRDRQRGDGFASVAGAMGEFHPRENCADKLTWARYANFMDPEVARNHTEIVRMGGALEKQQAVDTGEIKSSLERQTSQLLLNQERQGYAILSNQNTIAREQERMFWQAQVDAKNDKLSEARERAVMLEGQLLAANQAREADRRQAELLTAMNGQFCLANNRITAIENTMLKQPPFYPVGGIAAINPCPPYPTGSCC